MKIYFCEKCGVSIPLQEVVGGRATARDGKTYCQGCLPGGGGDAGDLKLYFCDNCRVSIPLQDVITNRAKVVDEQMFCFDCARLTEGQRSARKDRIQRELKEKEESRFRLHFCDSCNTSIPQSHLVTGRAVIRGGRTFCERCRGRAEGRRVSMLATAGVVVLLAAVFFAGYMILGAGGGLLAGETKARTGPDPMDLLENRVEDLESRAAKLDALEKSISGLDSLRVEQAKLSDGVTENSRQAHELTQALSAFRQEVDEQIGRVDERMREANEQITALAARLDALKKAQREEPRVVKPTPAAPGPEPKATPGEEPAAEQPKSELPDQVKGLLADLANADPGVRFSAAVGLGQSGEKAVIQPLIDTLKKDRDVFVRRACARSLGQLNAWKAVPVLIDALEDKEFFVANTAYESIQAITGQDFGFKEQLSRTETRRVVQKAKDWWDAHKDDRTE